MRYDLKVLIAPYKERVFAAFIDKVKLAEKDKHTERKRSDREKSQNKNKRDLGPFGPS